MTPARVVHGTVARRLRFGGAVIGLAVIALSLVSMLGYRADGRSVHASSTASTSVRADSVDMTEVEKLEAKKQLNPLKAVVLGAVEGLTEFLPVSSTGHLHVAEQLMDVGTTPGSKPAADAYTVIIQLGAIVAVLVVSWRRVLDVLNGLIGRSEVGKKLLLALIAAFVPAAVVGVLFDSLLEKHLLKTVPIAVAWLAGGAAILVLGARYRSAKSAGSALESITTKQSLIIGCAQALALWPGVSRSLVTILAAILVGLSLSAAVEFSFLLGLLTLSAAAGYKLLSDGGLVFDTYGSTNPLIGMVAAFVFAVIAVRWMITYLHKHDLSVFAWYRIAIGVLTLVLVATPIL